MSFTRYERNKAEGRSTGQRLPPPRTDFGTICHKIVLAPRYVFGFSAARPLEGVWGWIAERKVPTVSAIRFRDGITACFRLDM